MHPRQKLRLMALPGLLAPAALLGLQAIEHPIKPLHLSVVLIAGIVWIVALYIYTLRHREELRDPPEQRERQLKWAMRYGPAVLNAFIALLLIGDVAMVFRLNGGHLKAPQAILMRISLVASVPSLVFLIWIKVRLASMVRRQKRTNSA